MFKRGADALSGSTSSDVANPTLSQIRAAFSEEQTKLIESFEKRFPDLESRQDRLESKIEELERKLGRQPGSGGGLSPTFAPQFLEIKGFCTWDKRLE